ncbi:acyl-phosphate glycerol 3-phosphate acyltransferase [Gordonia sp. QH-12]|uniref:Lysophospholipid acyltransferase family protein n=2 Tax=Gordoniaceae TaxID=85026 RepID=A0ABN3HJS2_9ACTN|nr:acyl-phosphate glycerol 3-phosphate acyltransferase [Gordonia sp. QH-12]
MESSPWMPVSPCGVHCVHTHTPPVSRLRASVRLTSFAVVGVTILLFGLLTVACPRGLRHRYWRAGARVTLRSMGVLLEIDDRRPSHAPRLRGALIVANHISYLDIVAIACVAPARFVAKSEVLAMPGFGPIARLFGVLAHRRGDLRRLRPMIDRVGGILDAGRRVAVFPEGTTWCGTASGRFRPAFFQAAVDTGVPILPVRLSYTDRGSRTTMPGFLGEDTVASTLSRIVRSRHLTVTITIFDLQMPAGDRRGLAAAAQRLILPAEPVSAMRELDVDLSGQPPVPTAA